MTPALYRPLFPRKGERKERLYYASSKHPKSSLSSSQVVLSSFCRRQKSKKKRKTKEKERTTIPSPPPPKRCKNSYTSQIFGGPLFFFGCSFCLFVFMWVHHPFLCFFVFFFFILLVAFFCVARVCRDKARRLSSSRFFVFVPPIGFPPPFIYINVGIVFLIAPQKRRRRREDTTTTTTMSSAFAMHAKTSAFTTGAARVLSSSNASSNR